MSSGEKQKLLVVIHAETDTPEVQKLEKSLSPLTITQQLRVWHSGNAPLGEDRQAALLAALQHADAVAFWVSPDLWTNNSDFDFVQANISSIPAQTPVIPILGRPAAAWEMIPVLGSRAKNAIPASQQPMPAQAGQDEWLSAAAQNLANTLGFKIKPVNSYHSRWRNLGIEAKTGIIIGILGLLIAIVYGTIQSFLAIPSYRQDSAQNELLKTPKITALVNECSFPPEFKRDSLFILITRFEDDENEHETRCYGTSIAWRINDIAAKSRLPIRTCYRDDFSPIQEYDADIFRREINADLVIWGKLRNAGPDCRADGFCLRFNPSDTLISFAGGKVKKELEPTFQEHKSSIDLQTGLVSMAGESFDDWLLGMSNLKIGAKKPEFYLINESWPVEKKAEAFRIRGEAWLSLGVYEKAMSDFKQTAQLVPNNGNNYYKLGASANQLKNYELAIRYYDSSLIFDPGNTRTYFSRGEAKLKLEQFKAAFADFNKAIKLDPTNPSTYISRARLFTKFGMYDKALRDCNKALTIEPNSTYFLEYRIFVNSHAEFYSQALWDCYNLIKADPKNSHAYRIRASIFSRMGNSKAALRDFELYLKLGGERSRILSNRAWVYKNIGKMDEALNDLNEYANLYPKYSEALRSRGVLLMEMGLSEKALQDFNKSIELDTENYRAMANRGTLNADLGSFTHAIDDCNRAIAINPYSAANYHNRAYCYRKQGKYGLAVMDLVREFKIVPQRFWYLILVPVALFFCINWWRKWRKKRRNR
jgi:tetratricopeptide (TPR) repeat protein